MHQAPSGSDRRGDRTNGDVRADPVQPLRPRIQVVLDSFLDDQREVLAAAGAELLPLVDAAADLLRGGKRLRPAFCYWGWRSVVGAEDADDAVVTAASALELFQAAALVHDDLIDGSDTRRGHPSVHRRFATIHAEAGWAGGPEAFGLAAAVLLGDLLLGWSDELLGHAGLSPAAARRARPVFERMRTEVGGGQYLDVLAQADVPADPVAQADRARRVIRFKSARYSVEHPLLLGAAIADAGDEARGSFAAYGMALGEAFQLRDDILGVFGDPERTGKPAGDDLREGKRTLLVAYALERAGDDQRRTLDAALGDPDLDAARVETLREIIVGTGALARVESLVDTLVGDAAAALASAPVSDDGRKALTSLIGLATARAH